MEEKNEGGALRSGAFLRQSQVLQFVPISPATLWRRVKAGEFPKPVKLGPRVTAWEADAVREWLAAQKSRAA